MQLPHPVPSGLGRFRPAGPAMLIIPDEGGGGGNHLGIPTGFLLVPIQGPFFKMGPDLLERGGIGAARQQSPCHQVGVVGVASSAFTGLGPIGVDRVEKLHSFGKGSLRGLGFIRFVGGELDYRGIGLGNLGLNGSGLIKDGFGTGWDGGLAVGSDWPNPSGAIRTMPQRRGSIRMMVFRKEGGLRRQPTG